MLLIWVVRPGVYRGDKRGTEATLLAVHSLERAMGRALLAHVEVVLLTWQQLPDELITLNADWMFTESRFYRIAQVDIVGGLNIGLIGLFEQLKAENRITDFCSRVVVIKQAAYHEVPDTEQVVASELPDWVRPEI